MVRIINGKQVESKMLRENATVIACGNMLPTSNGIYGFKSDDEFQEWCDGLPVADVIYRAYRFIQQAQKYMDDDLASVKSTWMDFVENKS